MATSIINHVKKFANIPDAVDEFDMDIASIMNGVLLDIAMLIRDPRCIDYVVDSAENTWEESPFYELDTYGLIQLYATRKTVFLFDPPNNSYTQTLFKDQLEEERYRIHIYEAHKHMEIIG